MKKCYKENTLRHTNITASDFDTVPKVQLDHYMPVLAIAALILTIPLTGCQTTRDIPVMKRVNQTFETTGLGKSKLIAKQEALSYAKQTCKSEAPIIITDEMVYNGVLGEKMDKMVDKFGKVAGVIFGGVVSTDMAQDDDYEYTITFKCE